MDFIRTENFFEGKTILATRHLDQNKATALTFAYIRSWIFTDACIREGSIREIST